MYYFDKVKFTGNVMREKVCVDISIFSVISYRACAIASEIIQIGQNRLHHSLPHHRIKSNVEFEYIWGTTKRFLALCCKNWKTDENASLGIKNFPEIFQYYLITVHSWVFI